MYIELLLWIPIHGIIHSLSQPFWPPSLHANHLWLSYSLLNHLYIYQSMCEAACMCVCAYRPSGCLWGFWLKVKPTVCLTAPRPRGFSHWGVDCPAFSPQYCHMENRRISHWLPARAKANSNPHMHRSGYLEPPLFTITTDETQESLCFH